MSDKAPTEEGGAERMDEVPYGYYPTNPEVDNHNGKCDICGYVIQEEEHHALYCPKRK